MRVGKKTMLRMEAVLLSVSLVSGMAAFPAKAAEAAVQVDETLYVNSDYYGAAQNVNVVKSVGINGVETYTDHGRYKAVTNMTDQTKPVQDGDTVTWKLPDNTSRFYFEGTLDENTVQLPWTFDVSYKLNGVPIDADKLAGASGLVEIHIVAEPNTQTGEYFRNNMILTVAVPVDLNKCYSVDAPGSQTQNIGNYSGVVFMALPGEEGDFTIRLGTDDFSSTGIMMAMIPGTLSDLSKIKDLKEAKDTWRADADKLYSSASSLMQAMESMKGDVQEARSGVRDLKSAQSTFSANRGEMEHLSTEAVQDLRTVTDQMTVVIPYMDTAISGITEIQEDTNALRDSVVNTQDELDDLYDKLRRLRNAFLRASRQAKESKISDADRERALEEIRTLQGETRQVTGRIRKSVQDGKAARSRALQRLPELKAAIEQAQGFTFDEGEQALLQQIASSADLSAQEEQQLMAQILAGKQEASQKLAQLADPNYDTDLEKKLNRAGDLLDKVELLDDDTESAMDTMNGTLNQLSDLSGAGGSVTQGVQDLSDQLIYDLDDVKGLMDTLTAYEPSLVSAIGASRELMIRLNATTGAVQNLLHLVNDTAIAAGDSVDAGTRKTLDALDKTLGKSMTVLDRIGDVRAAGDDMKATLDKELDDLEDDSNFLNIDPDAPKVSFTSEENPEPHSLQIVLRTAEISDKAGTGSDISDAEPEPVKDTALSRIANVFRKIISVIKNALIG